MPTTGAATWSGAGAGVYSSSATSYQFVGDTSLSVNFATRNVNGAISNLHYSDGTTLINPTTEKLNTIALSGQINSASFSGTTTATLSNKPDVAGTLAGQFYGPSGGAPVEAAGAFAGGVNTTGMYYGGFIVGSQ
jgi:hypothetical protein